MSKRSLPQLSPIKKPRLSSPVLLERSMGIAEYVNPGLEISAIIKHRFQDFHVHELKNGEIVYLKNLELEKETVTPSSLTDLEKCNEIGELISHEFAEKLLELVEQKQGELITPAITEKEKRTLIHKKVREHYGSVMDSKTNGEFIVFYFSKGQKNDRRKSWKDLGGEYCHFSLYKENRDTMDAIGLIANMLKINPKLFSYAGTKDKRACTVQRIAVHRGKAEQIVKLNQRLRGLKLGDFKYETKGLTLADSKGNHFKVVLRDVKPQDPQLLFERLKSLRERGFLNYYGMQRFGTQQISTDKVGIAMLADDWKKAFELVVGGVYSTGSEVTESADNDVSKEARNAWVETRDPDKALGLFPRQCVAERAVLTSFAKQVKLVKDVEKVNYLQCIQSVTRNLRLMYVHAYQSRVWNEMASKRHVLFGQRLVAGDLVRTSHVDLEEVANRSEDMKVEVVTEETVEKFSIDDLVLPLPGHSVLYPTNQIGQEYQDFMGKDGFHPNKMERKIVDTNLPGSYRSVYVKPRHVAGKEFRYNGEPDCFIGEGAVESDPSGEKMAFLVEFSLGSSQYATMALREILGCETSASFHTVLSQQTKSQS